MIFFSFLLFSYSSLKTPHLPFSPTQETLLPPFYELLFSKAFFPGFPTDTFLLPPPRLVFRHLPCRTVPVLVKIPPTKRKDKKKRKREKRRKRKIMMGADCRDCRTSSMNQTPFATEKLPNIRLSKISKQSILRGFERDVTSTVKFHDSLSIPVEKDPPPRFTRSSLTSRFFLNLDT